MIGLSVKNTYIGHNCAVITFFADLDLEIDILPIGVFKERVFADLLNFLVKLIQIQVVSLTIFISGDENHDLMLIV